MNKAGTPTERGNVALYALLLFPVALLLAAIAVDVSGWNALRGKLQQEADRLAFQGLGGLPQPEDVKSRVQSAAEELISAGVNADVFFPAENGSSVGVTLEAQYRTSFDFLLRPLLQTAFHVRRSGVAELVPGDYVLIVADGGSLRPALVPSQVDPSHYSFASWGDSLEWPASRYFECVSAPVLSEPNALHWAWWNDWKNDEFRRWATQSCFNPVLTPLKLATIGLAESFAQYDVNRVSVLFTPGEATPRGWRAARHIHGEAESPELYPGRAGGFSPPGRPISAEWGNYLELNRFLGDEVCMLLTQPESSLTPHYEIPQSGWGTAHAENCAQPLGAPPCGGRHYASGHFSNCYLTEGLTLRDAVYWNAAKLPLPGFSAKPDILSALRQAWAELTDERTYETDKRVRGNLARSALRQAIVLTDFLPPARIELSELLTAFDAKGIQVTVVPFFHQGLSLDDTNALRVAIGEWKVLSEKNPRTLRISPAATPDELETSSVPRLLADGLQFALRS